VLLLDEPTSACDPEAARAVEAALLGCGAALVWVTHDAAQPGRVGGRQLELPGGAVSDIAGGLHAAARAAGAAAAAGGGRGVEVAIGP
jgi:ABC-type iron transport system FetAB ATPase subunit